MKVPGPVDTPDVGSLIAGKYRLERLIGEGGQAWIWKARHLELDSEVALKILRFSSADATQTERLRTEARAVAKLNHPAMVRVFDLGQTQHGNPYFAMEHLDGENLADSLARTDRLPPVEAVRLLLPIASAVAAAHAIGVVHRDLKPDNIFLAQGAHAVQPKLLDFGVAKHEVHENRSQKLTDVGTVLGSPSYLSPEQARGQADVDTRSDIWSFCTLLYECVTGKLPFSADNTHALLFSIAEDEPQSLAEHGVLEEELWSILRRGLQKSPPERWPNMRSLGRALAQWLSDRGVTSDVTGVMLDSTWFNPDLVTPPPESSGHTETTQGEPAARLGRSDATSHVESHTSGAAERSHGTARRRSIAQAIALLASAGAMVGFLAGTQRGLHVLGRLPLDLTKIVRGSSQPISVAQSLVRLGRMPHRLRVEHPVRAAQASMPSSAEGLVPLPVVPVEKLKLVGGPSVSLHRTDVPVVRAMTATKLVASPPPSVPPTTTLSAAPLAPAAPAPVPAAPGRLR